MFNLTHQERLALLFLAAMFFLGLSFRVMYKGGRQGQGIDPFFNEYAKADLNNATKARLMQVPGIGEKTAGRIIESRRACPFSSVDELKKVKGFTDKRLEKIRDFVYVKP